MFDVQMFLGHFRRQRAWTRSLAEAIPNEHFEWAPVEGAFSCGGLVRHLMQAEGFWRRLVVGAVQGEQYDPFDFAGTGEKRLDQFRGINLAASGDARLGSTAAECVERWASIQAKTEAALTTLTAEQLQTVQVQHPLLASGGPLWEMLWMMIEHEAHHRGQLSAYLKILGVRQLTLFVDR